MYDHILVPVAIDHQGRGEASLSVADRLLKSEGRITLLHVFEAIPAYAESHVPEEAASRRMLETRNALEALSLKAEHEVEIATVSGHSARAIIDFAEREQPDCVVLASHHPGVADYFLGSTAAWVASHADCSVYIIR